MQLILFNMASNILIDCTYHLPAIQPIEVFYATFSAPVCINLELPVLWICSELCREGSCLLSVVGFDPEYSVHSAGINWIARIFHLSHNDIYLIKNLAFLYLFSFTETLCICILSDIDTQHCFINDCRKVADMFTYTTSRVALEWQASQFSSNKLVMY